MRSSHLHLSSDRLRRRATRPRSAGSNLLSGLASRALHTVLERLPEESLAMEDVVLEVAHYRATIVFRIRYFEVLSRRRPRRLWGSSQSTV